MGEGIGKLCAAMSLSCVYACHDSDTATYCVEQQWKWQVISSDGDTLGADRFSRSSTDAGCKGFRCCQRRIKGELYFHSKLLSGIYLTPLRHNIDRHAKDGSSFSARLA